VRRRARACLALALVAVPTLPSLRHAAALELAREADGKAILILIDDSDRTDPGAALIRNDERRADAVLLVRWIRACDQLQVFSLPRDLVLQPDGQQLAVEYGLSGPGALAATVSRTFGVDVVARLTLDLAGVARLATLIGPVEVRLSAESRDQRTGFVGGPGDVQLEGSETVAFLRARDWEERSGDDWIPTSSDDLSRIARDQVYLRAAIAAVHQLGDLDRVRLVVRLAQAADIDVDDYMETTAFLVSARNATPVFQTIAVRPERTDEERRSPFAPQDYGATFRLVLAAGAGAAVVPSTCRPPQE
jgi:LCP family protein required for cell wall assembly